MRTFGIELELVAPRNAGEPNAHAQRILEQAGITCRTNSHFGRAYHTWQAKPDGSLQPAGRCTEVVSRILPPNDNAYEEVRRAVTALETAGYGVNRTCGFHVHLNVSDLPMRTRLLVALRYAEMSEQINTMLPPSRRANGFCHNLDSDNRSTLARAIANNAGVPSFGRYMTTNLAWVSATDGTARIEFRQAAGTCNADKVIGWVKFLQEMVDEVARRTPSSLTFGGRRTERVVSDAPRTVPTPVRVPRVRTGSHGDWVLNELTRTGVVTQAAAEQHGIMPHVFRSIISGFRRHGAQLTTIERQGGLAYRVSRPVTRVFPITRQDIFRSTEIAAPTRTEERVVDMPGASPQEHVRYDFFAGLSEQTAAWVRSRRAVFAEDTDEAQQVRA